MSEAENVFPLLQDRETIESPFDMLLNDKSTLESDNLANNLTENNSTDDENQAPLTGVRRRIKRFSDSDSEDEADKENIQIKNQASSAEVTSKPNISSESDDDIIPRKSRLRDNSDSSGSDNKSPENESRIGNKRNKLHEKFQGLLNSRSKAPEIQKDKSPCKSSEDNGNNSSDSSNSGIESIKKKIKHRSMLFKSGICDPDTSSDEESSQQREQKKKKPKQRSTILTSPKPARMSAKQAMENMQKIKSESNRMLREKEVSLPYHRSKALTLKDIMSRRKPALSADGKALPLKMNSDQLKQYVKLLEERNKEMMELCKSDTDEEDPIENSEQPSSQLNAGDCKGSSNNCLSVDQRMEDTELPYVNVLEKTNEDDLPDLTIEIIKKEQEKSSTDVEIVQEENEKSSTVVEIVQKELEKSSTDLEIVEEEQGKSSTDVEIVQKELEKSSTDVEIVQEEQGKSSTDVEIVQKELEKSSTDVEIVQEEQGKSSTDVEIVQKELEKSSIDVEIVQEEQGKSSTDVEIDQNEQDNLVTDAPGNNDINLKDFTAEIHSESKTVANNESQMIELHYETEKFGNSEPLDNALNSVEIILPSDETANDKYDKQTNGEHENTEDTSINPKNDKSQEFNDSFSDDFSDVDIDMEDLETIIENAKKNTGAEDAVNSPMLIRDPHTLNMKPKLTGAPGMLIDLDGSNPIGSRKLTGVELLKERFTYFAKLRTPEEKERERELKIKPGMQHVKLKQELEKQITEQRSLEWAKRLADEKQQQMEMDAVRGDETDEDDIEKIEAKLEEKENEKQDNTSSESEEEEEEDLPEIKDKPRKRNDMIDDEAEVSGEDEDAVSDSELAEEQPEEEVVKNVDENEDDDNDNEEDQEDSDESSDDTSEDEEENKSKSKKGRILKAFEDSDDENTPVSNELVRDVATEEGVNVETNNDTEKKDALSGQNIKDSQDDVLPLAQSNKSISEDLFASQASIVLPSPYPYTGDKNKPSDKENSDLGTQTFSILSTNMTEQTNAENILNIPDKLDVIFETQPISDAALDDVVGMCSGKFTQTQNVIPEESQVTESQCPIGDDILELCTGKFYDNQFVTQTQVDDKKEIEVNSVVETKKPPSKQTEEEKDLLDSILKEMEHPVNEEPKTRKYLFDNPNENEVVSFEVVNQVRKKFIIDSDDESATAPNVGKKKLKKRKREKRALQISDDEEDEEQLLSDEEVVDYMSDVDDDGVERIVEYDSEENEIEVKPQKQKKNRKMAEFFEQEAELTSEDEWVGSGDEDEAGLDRMEREAGDDDTFHEGQLQRELGQIHMRDVLDQDKREVRIIQELLFEDGDLGDGHRQRKFRWKDLDGEEGTDAMPNIFGDSQEEEFESEEQWRKQRHEREVFLRNLQKENETEDHNISIDRTTIIKANLCSKTMSSLLLEANGSKTEETVVEKKTAKEEPCPTAPLTVFQQNYHGSLLTRGRGALARLAALAMPLAGDADDDALPNIPKTSKGNFVFTSVTPVAKPKVAKRKAEENVKVGTPRLIKKLKTDDKNKFTKSSLLDHLKAL